MTKKWVPIESNPDVLNSYATTLGLDLSAHSFCDVYGLDEELLSMVPQPVLGVLLCYPITDDTEAAAKREDAEPPAAVIPTGPGGVYFMEQTVGNACGTIGLLHITGNLDGVPGIADGSFLQQFFSATRGLDPAARGKYLEDPPEGAPNIEEAHQSAAAQGNTAAPGEEDEVLLHFVAFVNHNGRLVQLDGRRPRPIDCGPTSTETLLKDTAVVVKRFAELTGSITFNLMALTAGAPDS